MEVEGTRIDEGHKGAGRGGGEGIRRTTGKRVAEGVGGDIREIGEDKVRGRRRE